MITNRFTRTVSLRPVIGSFLPFLLTFTGLTVIIVGILAMHVWMGGHGSTTHHVTASTTFNPLSTAGGDAGNAAGISGHTHDVAGSTVAKPLLPVAATGAVEAIRVAATDASLALVSSTTPGGVVDGGMLAGCGADCADEMMLGMCVLAIIIAGIACLLTPAGRALLSSVIRRGPPVLTRLSRPAPAPLLTQLCISRT
ncbi:hypothetical protein GM708_09855 [Vibrio cholerae]|nr:hypothetical protein [Vibrio cholerae]